MVIDHKFSIELSALFLVPLSSHQYIFGIVQLNNRGVTYDFGKCNFPKCDRRGMQEHMNEGKCGEDPCLPRFRTPDGVPRKLGDEDGHVKERNAVCVVR